MMRNKAAFTLLVSLGLVAGCSETGSDDHSSYTQIYVGQGTTSYDISFDDIYTALNEASNLLSSGSNVEVILSEDVYHLDKPIILGPEFSGDKAAPFKISAETPRKAILSGTHPVAVEWQKQSETLWVADLDAESFDTLYIDGVRQIRARYPNFDPEKYPFGGYAEDAISPERVAGWDDPSTGVFHALHDGRWGGWHYNIVGANEEGLVELGEPIGNNRPSKPHETFRYVENIFEELDAPGEWFYDAKVDKLFVYPKSAIDLNQAKISFSTNESLIELRGTAENPVSFIEIDGLKFSGTSMTFQKTTEPLLRSDWMIHRGGAIVFEGTETSFVRNSQFNDLGGNAIFFSGYNRHSGASGNLIYDIGASGVSVVGEPSAVRSPSFTYADYVAIEETDFEPGPKSNEYPSNIIIEDNLIRDIGFVEKQVAGVQISMAQHVNVINNSIYDVPRSGINIGDGTWGGHVLRGNDVFNTVLETGDHGAFNSWGRDRFWYPDREMMNGVAREYPDLILADAVQPVLIEGNRWQSDHGWDIDLDDGSSNYIIRNNICLSGGLKLREGFFRTVENNVLINNSFHPHVWFENSNDVFKHNIVMTDYKDILIDDWGENIDYNLFPTESALAEAQGFGLDQHSTFGAVEFINAAAGDYRVKKNSLAEQIGFKNFAMEFGVKSDWLKEQAETPTIPELFLNSSSNEDGGVIEFLGATVRSVTSEGDKSAFGLPEVSGVIIVNVPVDSLAFRGGLKARDVITGAFDDWNSDPETISNIDSLRSSYQARRWTGVNSFVIMRNQAEERVHVNLIE